jgi:hypothetical protein
MALPASGRMRQGADVNVELGNSATTQISLGQASVRSLYSVASGAIRLAADGYGKANTYIASYLVVAGGGGGGMDGFNGTQSGGGGGGGVLAGTATLIKGNAYTNSVENTFGLFKRRVYGIHHQISKKHIDKYINSFVFYFNNKTCQIAERFDIAMNMMFGKRLSYKNLISK